MVSRRPDDTFIVVPIPLSVARAIGCRPGATVRLHIEGDEIRVVPDTIRTEAFVIQMPTPNTTDLWMSCQSWWKKRGAT
jgi:hypothetical protein